LKYLGDDLPLTIDLEKREKVVEAGAHNIILHVDPDNCPVGAIAKISRRLRTFGEAPSDLKKLANTGVAGP
jgi:hypothetical protein